jgi:2-polyprenyl-3-methyl-5-hydroxy-6-metoxy-1,4-benzoquinol methylase
MVNRGAFWAIDPPYSIIYNVFRVYLRRYFPVPHICPAWLGYFLLNPIRKLFEDPERMLGGVVREGMTVLEPGCGMGYFTIPLAKMVGESGKIVAVDIQPGMLSALKRRALKAGLSERIEIRQAAEGGLGLEDLASRVDLVIAIHMVHEVTDRESFFRQTWNVLKPDGRLLLVEPQFHVSRKEMEKTVSLARGVGFVAVEGMKGLPSRGVLLEKH